MSGKSVTRPADLPQNEHWAVLVYSAISVPGYDKGDPDDRKEIVEYLTFDSKEALEEWVLEAVKFYAHKTFSVIHVKPAKVETSVKVEVK